MACGCRHLEVTQRPEAPDCWIHFSVSGWPEVCRAHTKHVNKCEKRIIPELKDIMSWMMARESNHTYQIYLEPIWREKSSHLGIYSIINPQVCMLLSMSQWSGIRRAFENKNWKAGKEIAEQSDPYAELWGYSIKRVLCIFRTIWESQNETNWVGVKHVFYKRTIFKPPIWSTPHFQNC